jgi:hypothetical protein
MSKVVIIERCSLKDIPLVFYSVTATFQYLKKWFSSSQYKKWFSGRQYENGSAAHSKKNGSAADSIKMGKRQTV